MVDERFQPGSKRRIARQRIAPGPSPRSLAADGRVRILTQRRRERALIPCVGRKALDRRAAAVLKRTFERLRFRPGSRQSGAGGGQCAFRTVAALGRGGAFLFCGFQLRLGG
jgi:hypothetical protein